MATLGYPTLEAFKDAVASCLHPAEVLRTQKLIPTWPLTVSRLIGALSRLLGFCKEVGEDALGAGKVLDRVRPYRRGFQHVTCQG